MLRVTTRVRKEMKPKNKAKSGQGSPISLVNVNNLEGNRASWGRQHLRELLQEPDHHSLFN